MGASHSERHPATIGASHSERYPAALGASQSDRYPATVLSVLLVLLNTCYTVRERGDCITLKYFTKMMIKIRPNH